jgi:hypothetical protein
MPTEDFTLTVSFPFFVIVSYSEYTPLLDHQLSIVSPSKRWTIDGLSMDNLPCYCLQTYCLFGMKKCVRKSQKLCFGKIDGKKRKYIQ